MTLTKCAKMVKVVQAHRGDERDKQSHVWPSIKVMNHELKDRKSMNEHSQEKAQETPKV